MLAEESLWIKKIIAEHFTDKCFPLLNVGSSTGYFRETVQPYIHKNIFLPLTEAGKMVIHIDLKMENGVDINGDLSNIKFHNKIKDLGIKSVLCSNLLEHLENPMAICESILKLLHSGDFIIVTTPYSFPFHKDPIDTFFRPDINQLHELFPATEIVSSDIVVSKDSYWSDLMRNKKYFLIMLTRLVLPLYKLHEWRYILNDFFHAKKKYSAACVLLRVK